MLTVPHVSSFETWDSAVTPTGLRASCSFLAADYLLSTACGQMSSLRGSTLFDLVLVSFL
jgi:hypothetical protein